MIIIGKIMGSAEPADPIVIIYATYKKRRDKYIMDLEKELEVSIKAAIKAGHAIMEIYNNIDDMQVEYKDGDMPLTAADKASDKIIVDALGNEFPDYAILSEEEKDDRARLSNDYCFIVDPLDGTKEFIKRNGQFTVNIALSYKHESVMGVIYVPVTGELYYAIKGKGAFLDNGNGVAERIEVSSCTDLEKLRIVMSSSHGCRQMDEIIEKYKFSNFVKMGSSLKGCIVAKGGAELYYRFNPTMEWDTAAMQCIVEEAGGIFMQMDDTPMRYNRKDSVNSKGFYVINNIANKLVLSGDSGN